MIARRSHFHAVIAALTLAACVPAAPAQQQVTSISQWGITWTFDRAVPAGQFANGDWWVVGPVSIIEIDPPSSKIEGRTRHGSMINPSPKLGQPQGYDSEMYYAKYQTPTSYKPSLNAALDVSASSPLVLEANSSLVSTITFAAPEQRPQVDSAAILTCLANPVPPGSFRPPYSGRDKTVRFNTSQLDYGKLRRLTPVGSPPELKDIERRFAGPWIDHAPGWLNRYMHPKRHMAEYGREFTRDISLASLMLQLDLPDAQKETLLVRFVQFGIDSYGVYDDGGQNNWIKNATHSMGRKWAILFAGMMLDNPQMKSFGVTPANKQCEDSMMFYVEETSPGVYNYGYGGYQAKHVGMPEWSGNHYFQPQYDNVDWFADPYRTCCQTLSMWGEILAAELMGARSLWNHDATFDYMYRYRVEMKNYLAQGKVKAWTLSAHPWLVEMWDAYAPGAYIGFLTSTSSGHDPDPDRPCVTCPPGTPGEDGDMAFEDEPDPPAEIEPGVTVSDSIAVVRGADGRLRVVDLGGQREVAFDPFRVGLDPGTPAREPEEGGGTWTTSARDSSEIGSGGSRVRNRPGFRGRFRSRSSMNRAFGGHGRGAIRSSAGGSSSSRSSSAGGSSGGGASSGSGGSSGSSGGHRDSPRPRDRD